MLNENADAIKGFLTKNKRTVLIISLFLLGVLLLLLSSPASLSDAEEQSFELSEYKKQLEAELSEICSSVKGVGRSRVTVTFLKGEEKIYKGSQLIEERPPRVMGVTVVCKGADNDEVRAELVEMMMALFDIGANRVSILKLNS